MIYDRTKLWSSRFRTDRRSLANRTNEDVEMTGLLRNIFADRGGDFSTGGKVSRTFYANYVDM